MLPLTYAVRNLLRSPGRLVQLVLGSGLVVLLVALALAFSTGMQHGLAASGDARTVLVLSAGSEDSIERSEVPRGLAGVLAARLPGLARTLGRAAVSPEMYYQGPVAVGAGPARPAVLRGVEPAALAVHRRVRLLEGRFPGADEVLVGCRAHEALGVPATALAIGQELRFDGHPYRIAGRYAAPDSVLEAELWLDLDDLLARTRRDTVSAVAIGLDTASIGDVELFLASYDRELVALAETAYYGQLAGFYRPLLAMAWLTALLVAAGAVFGGLNTLYAAFVARMSELAALQAIGFRRWMLLGSLVQESLLATLLGTAAGLGLGLLALDGLSVAFASGVFALRFDHGVLLGGLATGLALGLLGALPPAWRCLMPPITAVLRST
jgi:putative ABC transport system permease protein